MLHEFISSHRAEIVARARAKILSRSTPTPAEVEMRHVPLFLDLLVGRLRTPTSEGSGEIRAAASVHGAELLKLGLTIRQVVHDYGNLCQSITQLAVARNAQIPAEDYVILNRTLDDATADAVSEYGRQRELSIVGKSFEDLGSLAHEIRNSLSTATLLFQALELSNMSVIGETGSMLGRALHRMGELVNRTLAEVRIEAGTSSNEPISIANLLEEIEVAAMMDAKRRGVTLSIEPIEQELTVNGDLQILASVVSNLVQNACKFTKPNGHITLRTSATPDHVVIEVEDQCGGLPPGKAEELFRPFEQRGRDRSGVGLGLAICQKGVHALHGTIKVRNLPGTGCVFTVELPRSTT